MRYKFMVNGATYKARYGNNSYVTDISKSGYAYLAVYYDNNLMATGEQITVDGTVYTVTYGVTVAIRGEAGTSKVLSVTYNGVTNNVSVTFDGQTYNVAFTSSTQRRDFAASITPADTYAYIDVSDCAPGTWSYTIFTSSETKAGSFSLPLANAKKQELILGEFGGVATLTYKVSSGGTSTIMSMQHSSNDSQTVINAQLN